MATAVPDEWDELEAAMEAEMESEATPPAATTGPCLVLQLPVELLARILRFVPHATLVDSCFRASSRLSVAAATEARTRTQQMLQEALVAGFAAEGGSSSGGGSGPAVTPKPSLLRALACQLEQAIAGKGAARYTSKSRTLVFNLKKNPDLRARLVSGALSPSDLVTLSPEQLAGSELQQQRAEWRRRGKLRAMRPEKCSLGYPTDLYRCDGCGSSSTRVHRAVRAGRTHVDRATTYATCTVCKNRWEV